MGELSRSICKSIVKVKLNSILCSQNRFKLQVEMRNI